MAYLTLSPNMIERLIDMESEIHYSELAPAGAPFVVVERNAQILLSAPHGTRTFRSSDKEVWHEEDEYTASLALLIAEVCAVSAIAMNWKCGDYDPNYTRNDNLPYKQDIARLIKEQGVLYIIDLHGAALFSEGLDPDQTIDLGTRQKDPADKPSFNLNHVQYFEHILENTKDKCNPADFVVKRNRFAAASPGTITSFVVRQKVVGTEKPIQALQIEMKPQVRVAQRHTTASLYKSCGPFSASSGSVLHMMQSLVDFIEYLKEQKEP